jgi:hypothetical protein
MEDRTGCGNEALVSCDDEDEGDGDHSQHLQLSTLPIPLPCHCTPTFLLTTIKRREPHYYLAHLFATVAHQNSELN